MSGMAEEMERRIAEDGGAGLPDGAPGSAPGNEGGDGAGRQAPPAGESNADNASADGTQTIPYARFKEVNDRLGPYRELEEFGYDADSLRRLVAFETQYLTDPIGTWRGLADNLDLPQELKDAISSHLESNSGDGNGSSGRAQGEPPADGSKGLELPPEDKARLEYVDRLRERDAQAERDEQLDRVLGAWNGMDKEDGFELKDEKAVQAYERMKLAAIATTAGNGNFRSVEELAKAARETVMEFRNGILGDAVQRTVRGGSPASLPSGGPGASKVNFGGDIKAATRAAQAAMERGELPRLGE